MLNNCYKGKVGKPGIHKDFAKSLLTQRPESFYKGRLNIERPENCKEAELLIEFLLGVKLDIVIDSFVNKLNHSGYPSMSSTQFKREVTLAKLLGKDYLTRTDPHWGEKKIELGYFRYEFRGIYHDEYGDWEFNRSVFDSSYEMESSVIPNTIFIERGSGGIGGYVYGQPYITSFKELEHMSKFYENRFSEPRPEYVSYIDSLVKENKKYIYNDLKKKMNIK